MPQEPWDESDQLNEASPANERDQRPRPRARGARGAPDSRQPYNDPYRRSPYQSDPSDDLRRDTGRPRPRITRQSREEAYARLRQRQRQPESSRYRPPPGERTTTSNRSYEEPPYDTPPPPPRPQQRMRPPIDPERAEIARRRTTRTAPTSERRPRETQWSEQPRRRSVWATLLIGCIGGIVTVAVIAGIVAFFLFRTIPISILGIGTHSFTQQGQQPLPFSASTTQLQVHNRLGNIRIVVDTNPNTTTATLTYVKAVQARNNSDASAEFARISVKVQQGSSTDTSCPPSSCVVVNATEPETSNGSAQASGNKVDMTITLPQSVNTLSSNGNASTPFILTATTTIGDVSVENLDGVVTLTGDTGNVTVKGGLLIAGSCLQTRIGSVTFSGFLDTAKGPGSNPCTPGKQGTPTSGSQQTWFSMKSGTGNIDITLNAASTNIILDASIFNKGKINSDFPLNVQQNPDGSATYYGPLIPHTSPTALLQLTVNTGNITVHKA